jgi:hypothetical protein
MLKSRAGSGGIVLVISEVVPNETVREGLEKEAREERKWLWTEPQPVLP